MSNFEKLKRRNIQQIITGISSLLDTEGRNRMKVTHFRHESPRHENAGAIAIELPFAAGCRCSKNFGMRVERRNSLIRSLRASVFLRSSENKYVERIGNRGSL